MASAKEEEIQQSIEAQIEDEINDREFRIVLPKSDNSGRAISVDEFSEIATEISERFGGVTVHPSVAGCWIPDEGEMEGELVCEENLIMSTVRDSTEDVTFQEDEKWLNELAEEAGEDFGQYSIFTSENVVGADFIPGEFKEEIDESMTGRDVFQSLF